MPLLDEYQNRFRVSPTDPAKKILFAVMNDLLGRGGFDNIWDGCDDETREEILQSNLARIMHVLN